MYYILKAFKDNLYIYISTNNTMNNKMNTITITDILLRQSNLMLLKFNNVNKERVVKFFLKNIWTSKIQHSYKLDKRIQLTKLNFHQSVPQELKNITRVFYGWTTGIEEEQIKDITKLVSLQIKPNVNGGVNLRIEIC